MQVLINTVDIPFQVGDDVFVKRSLSFWSNDILTAVPYFSGRIQSIELGILPTSRLIRKSGAPVRVVVDLVIYEIQPHAHFNPFGPVQILDHVNDGASVFSSEQALLTATGQEPSLYLQTASFSTLQNSL